MAGYVPPDMLGYVVAGLCVLTVFATAMIYAQLRPVPRWHTWLTPASYLGFSLSSGMLLMVMLHPHYDGMAGGALGCLAIAWAVKALWWMRAAKADVRSGGSDTATATGLAGYADVRLFERPHMTKKLLDERNGVCGWPQTCQQAAGHNFIAGCSCSRITVGS